jgi:hypothetical protein
MLEWYLGGLEWCRTVWSEGGVPLAVSGAVYIYVDSCVPSVL